MKQYIFKFLPVEGKIRKDDWCRNSQGVLFQATTDTVAEGTVKQIPFLCNYDIQVGDKFTSNQGLGHQEFATGIVTRIDGNDIYMDDDSTPFSLSALIEYEGYHKVIGEVSKDALTYVRHGDQFDEEQILFVGMNVDAWGDCNNFKVDFDTYRKLTDVPKDITFPSRGRYKEKIQIKGPCGHFH